eukprot:11991578-Alexandrium_andersonii.AAC.1
MLSSMRDAERRRTYAHVQALNRLGIVGCGPRGASRHHDSSILEPVVPPAGALVVGRWLEPALVCCAVGSAGSRRAASARGVPR